MPQMGRSMVPRRGLNRLVVADADLPPKSGPSALVRPAAWPVDHARSLWETWYAGVFRRVMPVGYVPTVVLLCSMDAT